MFKKKLQLKYIRFMELISSFSEGFNALYNLNLVLESCTEM